MDLLTDLLREINLLRSNPGVYIARFPTGTGLIDPGTEAMEALEERQDISEVVQTCCAQIRNALALDQVQTLQSELQKRGIWVGSLGHCLFQLKGTPQELLFYLLNDYDMPCKGRKFNLLNRHFTACGVGVVSSSPPMGLLVLAGEFFPMTAQGKTYSLDRQRAGSDHVTDCGWRGSVMALITDKDVFYPIASHLETDLPQGAVSLKTKTTVIRRYGVTVRQVLREYTMRDGKRVIERIES